MNGARFLHTIYCDDVRHEIGGKVSLIGCYSSDLIVSRRAFPIVLPKLCAQVHVVTPIDEPFGELTLRAYLNDELLAELSLDGIGQTPADNMLPVAEAPARWAVVGAFMIFSPFALGEKNGSLRIDAQTESGTIRGMGLRLIIRESSGTKTAAPEESQR